jgi:hypothetical protein
MFFEPYIFDVLEVLLTDVEVGLQQRCFHFVFVIVGRDGRVAGL